jgi:hypothetical protein
LAVWELWLHIYTCRVLHTHYPLSLLPLTKNEHGDGAVIGYEQDRMGLQSSPPSRNGRLLEALLPRHSYAPLSARSELVVNCLVAVCIAVVGVPLRVLMADRRSLAVIGKWGFAGERWTVRLLKALRRDRGRVDDSGPMM